MRISSEECYLQQPLRPVSSRALTIVELLITVLCLAIAAAIVVPALGDTASWQLRSAAELLVADLEYARCEAISHGDDPRILVVNADGGGYSIVTRSDPSTPVVNPIGAVPYALQFGSGRAASMPRVRISASELGDDNLLGFGPFGELEQSTPATLTLSAGSYRITVTLDPITGEATVGPLQ